MTIERQNQHLDYLIDPRFTTSKIKRGEVKHELRVQIHELRVQIQKLGD